MLMYLKNMFDCYYCIKTFCTWNTLEKMLRKVLFSCTYSGAERHVTCKCFENTDFKGKCYEIMFASVHVTDDDISFCDGLGMLICKTAKPCINSM